MTLSRRMKLRLIALSVSLTVLVAGMVWGLDRLRRDVGRAFEAYRAARLVERARYHVTHAQILLAPAAPDVDGVAKKLEEAFDLFDAFSATRHAKQGAHAEHDPDEAEAAMRAAGDVLREVAATLDDDTRVPHDATVFAQLRESMKVALRSLNQAARLIDEAMVRTRRTADVTMHSTIVIVLILSVAIGVAAAVMSLWHYRDVIIPVRRLRDSARGLASGRFNERVVVSGDDEFAEVEREFNAMAMELDTLYHNLEDKVRTKSRELVRSERLTSVGFLAAGVAHEINNPLNIITGHAELALGRLKKLVDAGDPAGTENALGVIRDEAFRCKEIIEQLLSLARSDHRSRQVVSIAEIARDVQSLVAGLRQFRDRRLDVRCGHDDDLTVMGNAGELKQVLLNLTVNALQAVDEVVGEVFIDGRRSDGVVELSVSDNGRGMTPETLEHVFEPFYTERKGGEERGVGLGLSITHAIIGSHGGNIRAESEGPTRGSRFVIRLPITEAEAKTSSRSAHGGTR